MEGKGVATQPNKQEKPSASKKKPSASWKLLIDGDLLLYRFGFKHEDTFEWPDTEDFDEVQTTVTDLDSAINELDAFIENLCEQLHVKQYILCFTGSSPFRYQILPSYKHNRKNTPKPVLYYQLKEHLFENHPVKVKDNLEADDVMGILATKPSQFSYIICSIDKDLRQIPGWLFNWNKDTRPTFISKDQADRWFYRQCLTGDPVDGFSGCPGIGAKRAEKVLDAVYTAYNGNPPLQEVWKAICEEYKAKGLTESYALTQARMARILRAEDFDVSTNQPILWVPTRRRERCF